ncbi:MAG: molybdopterin dinucleotide binding domain-containing protein [Solidesulfovibrio sp. DCME]|uniref:molybdopterin dinucleotide binding domain-containing protein n=1 Tax=Solidesulfovibrio sp. DCME TaxID=3447380 RepID=UPI003D104C4E
MSHITGALVTVRTAKQGAEMESGKTNVKYLAEIATLRLNPDDLADLGLEEGGQAVLASAHGRAVVTCRAAEGPRGLFFLPLGEVANRLFSAAVTNGTGVPQWKYLEVTVSPKAPGDDAGEQAGGDGHAGVS